MSGPTTLFAAALVVLAASLCLAVDGDKGMRVPLMYAQAGESQLEAYMRVANARADGYIPKAIGSSLERYYEQYTGINSEYQYYGVIFCFSASDDDFLHRSFRKELEEEILSINAFVFKREQRIFLDPHETTCESLGDLPADFGGRHFRFFNLTQVESIGFSNTPSSWWFNGEFSAQSFGQFLRNTTGINYPTEHLRAFHYLQDKTATSALYQESLNKKGFFKTKMKFVARYFRDPSDLNILVVYANQKGDVDHIPEDEEAKLLARKLAAQHKGDSRVRIIELPLSSYREGIALSNSLRIDFHPAILYFSQNSTEKNYPGYKDPALYEGPKDAELLVNWILSTKEPAVPTPLLRGENTTEELGKVISVAASKTRLYEIIAFVTFQGKEPENDEKISVGKALVPMRDYAGLEPIRAFKVLHFQVNTSTDAFKAFCRSTKIGSSILKQDSAYLQFFPAHLVYSSTHQGKPLRYFGALTSRSAGHFMGKILDSAMKLDSKWSVFVDSSYLRIEDQPPHEEIQRRLAEAHRDTSRSQQIGVLSHDSTDTVNDVEDGEPLAHFTYGIAQA